METTINYSSSFLQFLKTSDCAIAKLLYKIHRKELNSCIGYKSLLVSDNELNYITFRTDGTISFLPSGKEHIVNDNGTWSKVGRQNAKPSKVIRKLLTTRAQRFFKDADFECFANTYKSNFNDSGYKMQLLDSDKIPDVYCMRRGDGEGTLSNSCMNGDASYLDIYANCSKLKILILTDKAGLLCGRSLVWQIDNSITLMDRIYVSKDFLYENFLAYAIDNNYWRKKDYKSYSNKTEFINTNGECITKDFTIFTDTDFDYYPYIDTFSYGNDGTLCNTSYSTDYEYNNTDGTRDGDSSDNDYDEDEDNEEDRVCVNGCWYNTDDSDIVYSESEGEYILYDNSIYIYDDGYFLRRNCTLITSPDDELDTNDIDYVDIDGDNYILNDNIIYSSLHGYILKRDSIEVCGIIHLRSDFSNQLQLFAA